LQAALQEVDRFSWAAPCRQLETAYERIRTIGRGRSGVVHLARHKARSDGGDREVAAAVPEGEGSEHVEGSGTDATGASTSSLVAFKRLHSQMSVNSSGPGQEPGVMAEAVREVQILSSVRHPNVVALEEVCTSGKGHTQTWYAVMEYVEYELGSLLEFAQQPLSEAQVKGLMQQVRDSPWDSCQAGCGERGTQPSFTAATAVNGRKFCVAESVVGGWMCGPCD
jgi:serine/threonine protein kinase